MTQDGLPPASVIEPVLGLEISEIVSIAAEWSPHGIVRQIVGAPVSSTKFGLTDKGEGNTRIFDDLRRLIVFRAALAYPRQVAVVAQEAVEQRLVDLGLPPNVVLGHFNGLSGRNDMETVAGLIVIGQAMAPILAIEADAGVLTGVPVATDSAEPGKFRWYPRVPGSPPQIECYGHPDPVVEALRWQVCEGQMIQPVGRLRPLRHKADKPLFLDTVSDVPLPITLDRVEEWGRSRLGSWADMATDGVILTAASDIQVVFPDLASSPKAAQNMSEAARLTLRSKNDSLFDLRVSFSLVEAKRAGRFAATEIAVLPNGPIERVTTKKAGPTWRPPCERFGRLVNERAEAFAMMLDAA